MTFEVFKTGQLRDSKTPNCPVFIPTKINDELIIELTINARYKIFDDHIPDVFHKALEQYFCKFFAGNI